jgi:ABC-2 type transport system ATP-binding protein
MSSNDSIIEIRGLSKRFGSIQALDKVDLTVTRGRIIGLLGANGAGKSTLLRHIIGLYLPDDGECRTLGCPAGKLGPVELARIGYVHQEGELLDWMTVRQLIRYVSVYYPTWNHDLEERYVRDFEISLKARVGSLSPGQRQRLAILLAICFEPELLILDEPAAALDPLARAQFLNLLLDLFGVPLSSGKDWSDPRERGTPNRTIIISSHILSDVEKVIDHVLIMDRGRILCDSPFDDLREKYVRVNLTSLAGPLPEKLPFANVVESRRNGTQAALTVRDLAPAQIDSAAASMNCQADLQPLPLEELYRLVVERK